VPLAELARLLNVTRPRNLKRNMALLEGLGLLEYVDGGYVTPADFEARMERELEDSGCNEAERSQREAVAREQAAFRNRAVDKAPERKAAQVEDAM